MMEMALDVRNYHGVSIRKGFTLVSCGSRTKHNGTPKPKATPFILDLMCKKTSGVFVCLSHRKKHKQNVTRTLPISLSLCSLYLHTCVFVSSTGGTQTLSIVKKEHHLNELFAAMVEGITLVVSDR